MAETVTRQATRIDRETGVREIAEFIGPGAVKTFAFTHLPPVDAEAGVVICSPLYAEFIRNYRREVLIGRRLAASGIAVQRFHYRGHGNSDGDVGDSTLETMRDDAISAAQRLLETTGVERLAFFGTRFGALVAAGAAAGSEGAPLALWDPVTDPKQYFRDILRSQQLQALMNGGKARSAQAEGPLATLERTGVAHVLGYSITKALYESGHGRTLEGELGISPRPVLILQLGEDPRLHRGLPALVAGWQGSGLDVEISSVGKQEPWWFTSGATVAQESLTRPSEITVDWLLRTLADDKGRSSE